MRHRIYISGKITGNPNYMKEFTAAEELLKKTYPDADVINPAKISAMLPAPLTHDEYMRFCYLELELCTSVLFLKNWRNSYGSNQERGYAIARDMIILEE